MAKSLLGLRKEAEHNYNKWRILAFSHDKLKEINKTQAEALQLANYFEGQVDMATEMLRLVVKPPQPNAVAGYQPCPYPNKPKPPAPPVPPPARNLHDRRP